MARTSHFTFIQNRFPAWLQAATPAQRSQLRERVIESHRASRGLAQALAPLQPADAFCRPRLQQALTRWFPDQSLPSVDEGRLWNHAEKRVMSWLEAAMQNFDADTQVTLYASETAEQPLAIDPARFVKGVRNLDVGLLYRYHLLDIVDNDPFRDRLAHHDRAAFAAELSMARLQGRIDSRGECLGEAALAGLDELTLANGARRKINCSYLTIAGVALRGPLVIALEPDARVEPCLVYLPGHPRLPLRQYASMRAVAKTLTRWLWQEQERVFFSRYVGHADKPRFVSALRQTLYPLYPYDQIHARVPVLEPGEHVSWIKRLFPAANDLYQATLDKNARLPMTLTTWREECFAARARSLLEGQILDAASVAVPVAQRDAVAQLGLIQHWLGIGLSVLNLAGFVVPGLGEAMLIVGGAQLVDEFLEGVHAANEHQAEAAIAHLFDVFENLAQLAALGAAAGHAEPAGPLHEWTRVDSNGTTKLWHGGTEAFAQPGPWPMDAPVPGWQPLQWQGRQWICLDGRRYAVQRASTGAWRLAPAHGHVHQPALLGSEDGPWLLAHERPLAWDTVRLLRRIDSLSNGLDDATRTMALRCSGYDAAALRQVLLDHRPVPALLLDSLEAFGATVPTPLPNPDEACLASAFPSLSPRMRGEILAQARAVDRIELRRSARLPLRIAETARLYLREARINRALAHFHLDASSQADRDLLVIAGLQRLPGWSGEVRVALLEQGRLVSAAGPAGSVTKRLVRAAQGYQPFDEAGQSLANHSDIYQAILQALPDQERDALGLGIDDAPRLREMLFTQAANDRRRSALDLGMVPVRPWYRLPTRLPGTRGIGYRLSGRARGWLSPDELFDQLYPAGPEEERELLRASLRHEAGPQPDAFMRLMQDLHAQYQRLDTTLQAWENDATGVAPERLVLRRAARREAAQCIRQAWRRERVDGPPGAMAHVALRIEGVDLDALPVLPDPMPHIRHLEITALANVSDNRLDEFLQAFAQVNILDLSNNALTTLPTHIGNLSELECLSLADNNLDLNDERNLGVLTRISTLQILNLSDAVVDLSVPTLQRLGQLPALRVLMADLNELSLGPGHFLALQQWPALEELHLGQNQITLDEASRAALAGLNRLRRLSLYENPLDLSPDLTGWTHLRQLDLEQSAIVDWPTGLTELLRQRPLVLRTLDLGRNAIRDIPSLSDTHFAEAVLAGEPDIYASFAYNPLTEQSRQHLRDIGLDVWEMSGETDDWHVDWPQDLQRHIEVTRDDPQWSPLYDLFRRLTETAEYQRSGMAMRLRMRRMVEALSTQQAQEEATGWGRAEVLQQIIDRLADAAQECIDQARLLFQEAETDVLLWRAVSQAAPGASDEQVAMDSAASLYRQRLLDERIGAIYQARVARRQALAQARDEEERAAAPALHPFDDISDGTLTDPSYPLDELEMALHARIQLHDRLDLPAQPSEMSFAYLARLSDATLQRLMTDVSQHAGLEQVANWASEQRFWQGWLRRLYPGPLADLAVRWEGASAYFDQLSEASSETGAYRGPEVPPAYIEALERDLGDTPGLNWRQDGVLQRIDLVSGRYANESMLYQRAAQLLLDTRRAAEMALYRDLSRALARGQQH